MRRFWVVALLVVAAVLTASPVGAQVERCTADSPATLTTMDATEPFNLGRAESGTRTLHLEFQTSGCRLTDAIVGQLPVTPRPFSTATADLPDDFSTVTSRQLIGEGLVAIDIDIRRAEVPAGSWTGRFAIGGSPEVLLVTTPLTIERQEPLWPWPAAIGLVAGFGGIALAALKLAAGVTALVGSLMSGRSSQNKFKSAFWWTMSIVVAPIKFIGSALGKLLEPKNLLALALGTGAGLAAFIAAYDANGSWALDLGSAVSLAGKVGGASLATAFAVLQKEPG